MVFDSVKSVNRIWPFWHSQHILDMISIYEIYLCRCHFDNPCISFPGLSYTITLFARGFEKCKVRVSAKERHGDGIFKCSFIKKRFSSNSQKFWVLIELNLTLISSWLILLHLWLINYESSTMIEYFRAIWTTSAIWNSQNWSKGWIFGRCKVSSVWSALYTF